MKRHKRWLREQRERHAEWEAARRTPIADDTYTCRHCGVVDETRGDDVSNGVCESCWYGARLEPCQWRARMRALGRPVETTELARVQDDMRRVCRYCTLPYERCGPELWRQQRKCCLDCTHGASALPKRHEAQHEGNDGEHEHGPSDGRRRAGDMRAEHEQRDSNEHDGQERE